MKTFATDEPLAVALAAAIDSGNVELRNRLLAENPGLATARLGDPLERCHSGAMSRSLLHVATDWPGKLPQRGGGRGRAGGGGRRQCPVRRPARGDAASRGREQR